MRTLGATALSAILLCGMAGGGVLPASATSAVADVPACKGRTATIVATGPDQVVTGTDGPDVISAAGFAGVVVRAGAGDDVVCGAARTIGGRGDDTIVVEQAGEAYGGPGDDHVEPTITLTDGTFAQRPVFALQGGPGDDVIDLASPVEAGHSYECGRTCRFRLSGDAGVDTVRMTIRNDDAPKDRTGASLYTGKIKYWGTVARVRTFENLVGSPHPDILLGSNGPNRILGKAGNDLVNGYAGRDVIIGGRGRDHANGGPGRDVCRTEYRMSC